MSQFDSAVQTMLYTRLSAGIASAGVYDFVPQLPAGKPRNLFPYIVVGDDNIRPWDTDDTIGAVVLASLHIFSRADGKKEAKDIMGEIDVLLNRGAANLTLSGYRVVDCLFDYSDIFTDNDGVTRHGVCRYKLTIEKV